MHFVVFDAWRPRGTSHLCELTGMYYHAAAVVSKSHNVHKPDLTTRNHYDQPGHLKSSIRVSWKPVRDYVLPYNNFGFIYDDSEHNVFGIAIESTKIAVFINSLLFYLTLHSPENIRISLTLQKLEPMGYIFHSNFPGGLREKIMYNCLLRECFVVFCILFVCLFCLSCTSSTILIIIIIIIIFLNLFFCPR